MNTPPLRSFRVENFKAIRDSGHIKLGWLTVFIGNNGAGKSSLIEGLESFRDIVTDGLDFAMRRWRGFEQVWNKAPDRKLLQRVDHRTGRSHPMKFRFDWKRGRQRFTGQQSITQGAGGNSLFIQQEQIIQGRPDRVERWTRFDRGDVFLVGQRPPGSHSEVLKMPKLADGESMFKQFASEVFERYESSLCSLACDIRSRRQSWSSRKLKMDWTRARPTCSWRRSAPPSRRVRRRLSRRRIRPICWIFSTFRILSSWNVKRGSRSSAARTPQSSPVAGRRRIQNKIKPSPRP